MAPILLIAQTPQSFSYQAVLRDNMGNVMASQSVELKISILQGSTEGAVAYSESFNINTNEYGLINVEVGNGDVVSGVFENIDWGASTYFMKVEVDANDGSGFQFLGTTQLLSVPYALHSKTAENVFSGSYLDLTDSPTSLSYFTNDLGYLTSFTEADPLFSSHPAYGISATNIANWNSAYGWGDHSAEGYLTSEIDGSITNEIQDLSLSSNILTITNNISATNIDLNPYLDNTDSWLKNGNDIYFNDGNVGIGLGTSTPAAKLYVRSSASDDIPALQIGGGGDAPTEYPAYIIGRSSNFNSTVLYLASNRISSPDYNFIESIIDYDGTKNTAFIVTGNSHVGIGLSNPSSALDVNGRITTSSGGNSDQW